jgi:hypothetical protein
LGAKKNVYEPVIRQHKRSSSKIEMWCAVTILRNIVFLRRHNQWSPILWCAKQHENEQPPQSVRHSGSFQLNCVSLHFACEILPNLTSSLVTKLVEWAPEMIRPFGTLKSVWYLSQGIVKELVYGSKPRDVQELRAKIQGFIVPVPSQCYTYADNSGGWVQPRWINFFIF